MNRITNANSLNRHNNVIFIIMVSCYFLLFALTIFPNIRRSLPYVFTNDEYYVVDQAVGYTTGNYSRSIGGLMFGYGDFPIVIESFGLIVQKHFYIAKKMANYLSREFRNKKKSGDELRRIYAQYHEVDNKYYKDYFIDPSGPFTVVRSFSLIFAILSLLISYKISRLFLDTRWSILVLASIGIIPVFHSYAGSAKVEMALTFTSLAFLYFSMKSILVPDKYRYFFLSGLFLGLAMCSKLNAIFLLIPFIYAIITSLRNRERNKANIRNVILFAIGGFVFSFVMLGPNYFFNNILMNTQIVATHFILAHKHVVFRSGLALLLNGSKEFGILFDIFILLGVVFLITRREHINKLKYIVVLYVLSIFTPFVVFSGDFESPLYILPILPVLAILGVYAIQLCYQHVKLKATIKRAILVVVLILAGYPMVDKVSGEVLAALKSKSDTRIEAKQWIEENIPKDCKLFYMGRYKDLPPIRARNRMAVDRSRDEQFNQSLKIHFDRFLDYIGNSDRYYIEDYTGRYWRKDEFENVLNLEHLNKNNIAYVVYCPDSFGVFEEKAFEKQKVVVDKLIDDLRRNAVLLKEFRSGTAIKNGPVLKIFKLKHS